MLGASEELEESPPRWAVLSDNLIRTMGGSVRCLTGFIFLVGTVGAALLPGGVSALDLISTTPAPPAAVTQAVQPVTQSVTQAAQPVQSVVGSPAASPTTAIQPEPFALQTPDVTAVTSAPLPAGENVGGRPTGVGSMGAGAASLPDGSGSSRARNESVPAADTPPPPQRGRFNVAADSSVAACAGDCSQSLCPALVPDPLAAGCASASRLPALIGLVLATTGFPVLALLLGVITLATGFVVTRRQRRLERPGD